MGIKKSINSRTSFVVVQGVAQSNEKMGYKSKRCIVVAARKRSWTTTSQEWNGRDSDELCGLANETRYHEEYFLDLFEVDMDEVNSMLAQKTSVLEKICKEYRGALIVDYGKVEVRLEELSVHPTRGEALATYKISAEECEKHHFNRTIVAVHRGGRGQYVCGWVDWAFKANGEVASSFEDVTKEKQCEIEFAYEFVETLLEEGGVLDERYRYFE